jgi:hypothetical protein
MFNSVVAQYLMEKDTKKAKYLLEKATKYGEPFAFQLLGEIYQN